MAKRRPAKKPLEGDEEIVERPPRRRRRFMRKFLILGILLFALIAVAPLLIANSPLRDMLLNWQMPVGGWRIQCGQAQMSWVGSQSLTNVAVTDPGGHPLFTADFLGIDRSLLGLAINSANLGTVKFVKPVAYVASRPDGTNLEDFLAAVERQQQLSSPGSTATENSSRQVNLEITDGVLRGIDTATGEQWAISEINLTAHRDSTNGIIAADGTAAIAGKKNESGRVKFRMLPAEDGRQQLDTLVEGLMLEPFTPLLRKVLGEAQLAGMMSLDGHAIWAMSPEGKINLLTWGRAEVAGLDVSAAVLRGDRLRSDKVVLPWKLGTNGDYISLEDFRLEGDWINAKADGTLALPTFGALSVADLRQPEFSFEATVSLAKLARMMPNSLQLREGVTIDTGELYAEVFAESGGKKKYKWSAMTAISQLGGQANGRKLSWDEPVAASAAWIDSDNGPRLDRFYLKSPFANAEFKTAANQVSGSFDCDLAILTEELNQFIDSQGLTGRGTAKGNLTLTASEGDAFAADADITLTEFAALRGKDTVWGEPKLNVKLNAVGSAAQLVPKSVSTGKLELRGDRDQATLTLTSPIDLSNPQAWSVAIDGAGPLDSWADRLRPWLASVPREIAGDATFSANVTVVPGAVKLSGLKGTIDELKVRDGAVVVDEPHVELSGDLSWNNAERKLNSSQLQLACSVVAFRSRDLRLEFPDGKVPVMTGDLAFRADLERAAGAAGVIKKGGPWPRGAASGVLRFATNSEQVLADFSFDADQLQLVKSDSGTTRVIWAEPKLHSAGKAIYTIAAQRAAIDSLRVDGQTMQLAGAAQWQQPLTNGPISVSGNLQYDPTAISGLVAGYAGPAVMVEGDRIVRFDARGTLPSSGIRTHWSRNWQGTAEAGWASASAFGLPISAGKLQGTLADGQLRFAPLDVSIGAGNLTAQPLAILDPAPQRIVNPAGPLITRVQISPAVSEQMLKYVAPILAGATRVDGQFSLDLAETQIALAEPKKTRTAGKLGVHQLTVMPGPLLVDIVNIIQQAQSLKNPENLLSGLAAAKPTKLLSMNDQQIDFKVVDGRVYHRQLEFIIDDVPIRSTGSVGFDQTLALEIAIPIQDRWIDGEDALRGLAGQTLSIPIQGTFQNPRVDQRALTNITKQLIRNTAGQAIGNEIGRQLEKLFQGK